MPYFVQKGADLGRKLVHAFAQAFQAGVRKTVVLGSDTPHINPAAIRLSLIITRAPCGGGCCICPASSP